MAEYCPRTSEATVTNLADYEALAKWAESAAGADAIATALGTPPTVEEQTLADAHDAVLHRVLSDERTDPDQ